MASKIEAVVRQAIKTFSKKLPSLNFEENLTKLKSLASELTSADVMFDTALLFSAEDHSDCKRNKWNQQRLAPVTYIEIFENSVVTIGIFVLKTGARLPLHDHPLMYGVLKVIHGTIHIMSYTPVSGVHVLDDEEQVRTGDMGQSVFSNDIVDARDIGITPKTLYRQVTLLAVKEPDILVCESDDACVLFPRQKNIHEIHAISGPAAFVDILAPPYRSDIPGVGPRPCRYFKDVTHHEESSVKTLLRIPSPTDYWSDSAPYQGPSFVTDKNKVS